jgi:GMP synthase PP-ATPase subunit
MNERYDKIIEFFMKIDRFHAILVDHGFMRKDECIKVHEELVQKLHINLKVVDASDIFFSKLQGVSNKLFYIDQ